MRIHDTLDAPGGSPTIVTTTTPTTLHLGQALRAADVGTLLGRAVALSAGTLDGMLASIHVGDIGTLVAYRADVARSAP